MTDDAVLDHAEIVDGYNIDVHEPGSPDYYIFQSAQLVCRHFLRQVRARQRDEAALAIVAGCEARGE